VTIRGVLGPNGERPILDGNGATTRAQLNYPSRVRGVIKIGASVVPFADGTSVMPQWIVIENLEIRGAHNPNTFTGPTGVTETYTSPASAIYVEFGENITVRNCDMNNNGNGLFVFSSNTIASRDILVEGNYIHDNGNVGSNFEHNVYVEAIGITFQYNHLGALLPGAGGNNLQVLDNYGRLTLAQNWFKTGWTPFVSGHPKGTITNNGTVTGTSPGFVSEAGQDYHLTAASQAVDAGTVLNPAVLPDDNVVRE
jgi:hypothetical protein